MILPMLDISDPDGSRAGTGSPSPDLIARLEARIYGLVNRGTSICVNFVNPPEGDRRCDTCGYPADVHLLRDALALLRAAPATEPDPRDVGDWDIGGQVVKKWPDGSWTIDSRDGNRRRVWFLCSDCGNRAETISSSVGAAPAPPVPTEDQAIVAAARAYAAAEGRWQEALGAWQRDGPIPRAIKDARNAQAAAQADLLAAVGRLPPPTAPR